MTIAATAPRDNGSFVTEAGAVGRVDGVLTAAAVVDGDGAVVVMRVVPVAPLVRMEAPVFVFVVGNVVVGDALHMVHTVGQFVATSGQLLHMLSSRK